MAQPTDTMEQTAAPQPQPGSQTTADLFESLLRLDNAPEQFLATLLAIQCKVGPCSTGVILRPADKRADVIASWPPVQPGAPPPDWLTQCGDAVGQALTTNRSTIKALHEEADLYGGAPRRHLIAIPLQASGFPGVGVFIIETTEAAAVTIARDRLETTVGFLAMFQMQGALRQRQADVQRLRDALELLPAVNEHDRFVAAAMALCNESAARWGCERVSLGFLKGRVVHLKAMSHTEKFSRKMKLVQDLEAAMEECVDQDMEVLHPAPPDAAYVSRETAELSTGYGRTCVLSLPLRREGKPVAVFTLERHADKPFTLPEVEAIRLACELFSARLITLQAHDRWFGARMATATRKLAAAAVGPEHTWKKLIVIGVVLALLFVTFGRGTYTVEASFVFEPVEHQTVPAPFDSYIEKVFVEPGDEVKAGQVLAKLDTSKLDSEIALAEAERTRYLKECSLKRSEGKEAEAQVAFAQAEQSEAQIRLLQYERSNAYIKSPIDGRVIKGDLKRLHSPPVKTGNELFQIAQISDLRAKLSVPEDRIPDVDEYIGSNTVDGAAVKVTGKLATAAFPEYKFPFTIDRINPAAEVESQRNVFHVRANLDETAPWMRPGMEGLAKIELGRRSYAWLWTHRLIDWVRMKLWI